MVTLIKKEIFQFFSSLTGYVAIAVFLLLCGLLLFVIPSNSILDYNILDYGYASLEKFFKLAPWVFLLLIPAITMRLFADEFKAGTFELLKTKPLTNGQIVMGKFFGAFFIVVIAILPTLIYVVAIRAMTTNVQLDTGSIVGSYIGLCLLAATFVAVGLCCSSFTSNAVAAFIIGVLVSMLLFFFFTAISRMPFFKGSADYYIESLGVDFHYRSISRGVIDTRDIVYFLSVISLFLFITYRNLIKR